MPEVLGKTCKILQGPETDPDRLRDLHAGIAANCKTTVQLVNYTKNGERFLNELTIEPLRNQAGEVTHFIGSMNPVLLPASMSAAHSPLCGTLAADKLEKPPAALRHRGESSPARGAQGAAERAGPSAAGVSLPAAAVGAGMPGAQGSAAPQAGAEYTDLLSRGSFPLHTLNHHPNAPVLLRMLQLNNCSMGRASFPGRSLDSQAASQPGGPSPRAGEWQLSAERAAVMASSSQGQPSPTAESMNAGEWPQLSALLAKAWSRRGGGGSAAERPGGGVERQGQVGTGSSSSQTQAQGAMPHGSIALPGNLQSLHGEANEQQRCDTESFLAAVAGQGVLTSSWPASHVACNAHAHAPASHVRNVCGETSAHVGGGGGGSGLGLSVSSGMGEQGPLSPSRGPLPGYEQPQYGKRTCGDPSGPPEMRQRLQQLQQLQQLQGLQGLQPLPPAGFPQQPAPARGSSSCPASPQSQPQRHQSQAQAHASQQMAQASQQQQQLQQQQLLQRQQQAQQHSQLVAAQQMLQHQQVQHQQQHVRAQAARQHLQQQAAQHLQQARAQAQAQALSQALTQAQSQQSQYGHASAQVAQAQAMHEAKRRGGLQAGLAGGASQEAREGGEHAEGQGKQKRGRRRSKSALNEEAGGSAAAGPSGAEGQGQPGDDLMDELIESLFTEELGTIRYQQQGALGHVELPATPVAQEATSPPPEISSSLSSAAGGTSRKRSAPSSDDNLCGNDILQFEVDDALLLDV